MPGRGPTTPIRSSCLCSSAVSARPTSTRYLPPQAIAVRCSSPAGMSVNRVRNTTLAWSMSTRLKSPRGSKTASRPSPALEARDSPGYSPSGSVWPATGSKRSSRTRRTTPAEAARPPVASAARSAGRSLGCTETMWRPLLSRRRSLAGRSSVRTILPSAIASTTAPRPSAGQTQRKSSSPIRSPAAGSRWCSQSSRPVIGS